MIGPILAIGILAAILATLIPHIIRSRREDRQLDATIRCGPGCLCQGERVRSYQAMRMDAPQQIAPPQPLVIHVPPQVIYVEQPAPVYMRQSQPQVIMIPAQQPQYQPRVNEEIADILQKPQMRDSQLFGNSAPQSYYPGYSPEPDPQEVRYLPSQPIAQLPPARASDIEEARRKWERECEEMRR